MSYRLGAFRKERPEIERGKPAHGVVQFLATPPRAYLDHLEGLRLARGKECLVELPQIFFRQLELECVVILAQIVEKFAPNPPARATG